MNEKKVARHFAVFQRSTLIGIDRNIAGFVLTGMFRKMAALAEFWLLNLRLVRQAHVEVIIA